MSQIKPWHDCPPCQKCGAHVATPQAVSGRHGVITDPSALYCPACGADWIEPFPMRVAQAWWSHGAYEATQSLEGRGAASPWRKAAGELPGV